MHKWNVYVHSTPPYQPFEYSHKDAKLSKGLPSSNKNIHQMLLVHDSKRCNCNSFVWQSKSDYFLPLQRIQNTFKIELCARWCLFFNSLEAILKRTWQLHCTLQKVQEIVHAILNGNWIVSIPPNSILNGIVSWSNFQIIAVLWRLWSYSNDQPDWFWFASRIWLSFIIHKWNL